ncbi:MAG: hypothetical protein ACT452_11950 [Microthrixaceae bacterium]
MPMPRRATRPDPPAEPSAATFATYLSSKRTAGAITQLVIFAVVAGLAISRARNGALPPSELVLIVAGAALAAALVGWPLALYDGAADRLAGRVAPTPIGPTDPVDDPFHDRRLWGHAGRWAVGAAAWAGCGAVVLAAVLGQSSAPYLVVAVALVLLAGAAAVAVDTAGRAVGVRSAEGFLLSRPDPVDSRRRGWRDIALPIALSQLLVNAAFGWVLFAGHALCSPDAPPLVEGEVFADALIVVSILTAIFGAVATRWGQLDAAVGRVVVAPEASRGVAAKTPLGGQALIYIVLGGLLLAKGASFVLPDEPSVGRVMLVRGVFAAVLAFVVVGLGYTRGAVNGAAGAAELAPLDPARPVAPPPGARPWPRLRRVPLAGAGAAAIVVVFGVAVLLPGARQPVRADALAALNLSAEAEAFPMRVEYDIPLPAGTGTAAHTIGEIRRVSGSDNAKGLSAAPSHLDAVVGGTYADPDKSRKGDESNVPQVECFYPGALLDTSFYFPTGNRPETADAPAVGYATARCDAGPYAELHARTGEAGGARTALDALGAIGTAGSAKSDTLLRTNAGTLTATTNARAQDLDLFDGLLTVGAVEVESSSSLTGRPGEATTAASVSVSGIDAGGVQFSVRNGDIVVGDDVVPATSAAGRQVLDAATTALRAFDCDLAVLDDPAAYPQGFLFSRPPPKVGVAPDGKAASSMVGGLLVTCDPPQEITGLTDLNPQRVQMLFGFAFSSAAASDDIGGFGLGNLPSSGGGDGELTSTLGEVFATAPPPALRAAPTALPQAPPVATARPPAVAISPIACAATLRADDWIASDTWPWVIALMGWATLTHVGLRRIRRETGDDA